MSCNLGSFTYLLCIVTSSASFSVVWCNTNLQIGQAKKIYIQTGSRDTIRICPLNQQSRNLWSFTETINREMADLEVNVSLMNSRYVTGNLHVLHAWSWAQFLWVKCMKFLLELCLWSLQIFTLPLDTLLYPAHDYRGQTVSILFRLSEQFLHISRLLVCQVAKN
jgi:hypothetical protein